MMKRVISNTCISLFVVLYAFSSSGALYTPASATHQGTITQELCDMMEQDEYRGDSSLLIPVSIWFCDSVDNENALAIAEEQTGLSMDELTSAIPLFTEEDYAFLKNLDDDAFEEEATKRIDRDAMAIEEGKSLLMNELIAAKRAESRKMYETQNHTFLQEIGLLEERCQFISSYSSLVFSNLTSEEIKRISEYDLISEISYRSEETGFREDSTITDGDVTTDAFGEYVRDTLGWKGSGVKVGVLEWGSYIPVTAGIVNLIYADNPLYSNRDTSQGGLSHARDIGAILAGSSGFAPNATVYSTISKNGFYAAAEKLLSCNVAIISCSFGLGNANHGAYTDYDKWADHITSQHNVTLVKSAGNSSTYITTPGMAYNAITVGAHKGARIAVASQGMWAGSNYEEYSSRAEKPDLVALGYRIRFNDNADYASGTSYAAPAVAGTIAQMMQGSAALKARPTLAKALVCAGARYWCKNISTTSSLNGIYMFSEKQGAGMLNAKTAASILSSGRYYYASGGTTASSISRTVNVTSSDAIIKICLTWEKRNKYSGEHVNGNISEQPALSNWDLKVISPNGTTTRISQSMYNNVELIAFIPTLYGEYTIVATKISGSASTEYLSIAWY